jgi:hypothetical protein
MFKVIVVALLLLIALPTVTPILVGAGILATGSFVMDYGVYIMRFVALVFVLWLLNRNKDKIHALLNRGK